MRDNERGAGEPDIRGVRVSANELLIRAEGPKIATAGPDGLVVPHDVTLGRGFGAALEVLTGIAPGDADDRVVTLVAHQFG